MTKSDLERIAILLRTWDALKSIGITEVFATEAAFYLRGPALKLERNMQGMFRYEFNESFARHFNIPIQVDRWPNSYRIRNTTPQWFQLPDSEGLHISYVLEGLQSALNDLLDPENEADEIEVELIVEPGYPWPEKDVDYFSAKEKKWYRSSRPEAAVKVQTREMGEDKIAWALNFCEILPTICPTSAPKAVIGDINGLEYIVTHASPVMQSKVADEHSGYLQKCGGMIFPSLATGVIPAANFGEAILVAHPGVILPSLAPYKQKGAYPIVTYPTDVWTDISRDFVDGHAATRAFKQLYGGENYHYAQHFWILGPLIKDEGFGGEETKPITSTNSLKTAIKRRASMWQRDISKEKFQALSDQMTAERYGYLESKSHVIMDWKCFVLAAAPVQFLNETRKSLEGYGYSGDLIGVEVSDKVASSYLPNNMSSEERGFLNYQYSWAAADAIKAYARESGLVMNVMLK